MLDQVPGLKTPLLPNWRASEKGLLTRKSKNSSKSTLTQTSTLFSKRTLLIQSSPTASLKHLKLDSPISQNKLASSELLKEEEQASMIRLLLCRQSAAALLGVEV